MIVYNYTKVRRREKKLYSFFDATISKNGIALGSIKTSAALLILFFIPGIIICAITGTFWYNPISLATSSATGYFYIFFIFVPICLGFWLNTQKIQNYKLIDFLKIYFSPKTPLNQDGKKLKIQSYEINCFVEK